ncbi:MAG TPA: hypothetical protein VEA63_06970 [Opitutus sp.]|nr:hypothetical protein [Opitutus sp.]
MGEQITEQMWGLHADREAPCDRCYAMISMVIAGQSTWQNINDLHHDCRLAAINVGLIRWVPVQRMSLSDAGQLRTLIEAFEEGNE